MIVLQLENKMTFVLQVLPTLGNARDCIIFVDFRFHPRRLFSVLL